MVLCFYPFVFIFLLAGDLSAVRTALTFLITFSPWWRVACPEGPPPPFGKGLHGGLAGYCQSFETNGGLNHFLLVHF